MKLKYYLRGLGIGIIVTTVLLMIAFALHKPVMSDADVINRAKQLGMIMPEDEETLQSTENTETTEATEVSETTEENTETVQTETDTENHRIRQTQLQQIPKLLGQKIQIMVR